MTQSVNFKNKTHNNINNISVCRDLGRIVARGTQYFSV